MMEPVEIGDCGGYVVEAAEPAIGLMGWVAVHTQGPRGSCGGVRLCPDVRREEVVALARAMAYKYGFCEMELGGAKAGVVIAQGIKAGERAFLLRRFGQRIAGLLRTGLYRPWTDMGCASADVRLIYEGAGISMTADLPNTAYATAVAVSQAVQATAEHLRLQAGRCRVVIEGLGAVGRQLARELSDWGAVIVGASTVHGAAINERGLDIERVLQAAQTRGDAWVTEAGPWQCTERSALFAVETDVFVPCARVGTLDEPRARALRCRAVVPAANVPLTPEGRVVVEQRGIPVLPDFVVNSGGIIGGRVAGDHDLLRMLFRGPFRAMIGRMITAAERTGVSMTELAKREAEAGYRAVGRRAGAPPDLADKVRRRAERLGRWGAALAVRRAAERMQSVLDARFSEAT